MIVLNFSFLDVTSYFESSAEETAQEIFLIRQCVEAELKIIQNEYKRKIVASQAFGYIAIAFMASLPATIILNDLSKLRLKWSYKRLENRIKSLKDLKRRRRVAASVLELKDGLEMCQSIQITRRQICDFDSLFLKSLVKMHAKVNQKDHSW